MRPAHDSNLFTLCKEKIGARPAVVGPVPARKAAASCWRLPKQVIESKGYYPTICEKIVLIFTFGLMYKAKINSN
jgi:hypothetical protein